jgi:single-stranded-DNA-specific exonuclease
MRTFENATRFLSDVAAGPVAVVMDSDADGLSAGRLVAYTLEGKGEYAYSPEVVRKVEAAEPSAVVVVDTGAAAENPFAPRPVLVLDHHQPLGIPPGATFVSSYRNKPPETSALITYLACQPLANLQPVEWLVLLGVFGDLGDSKDFPYLDPLVRRYTKTRVRKAVTLLNAARRSSSGDAAVAYRALCEARKVEDIIEMRTPAARRLEALSKDVRQAMDETGRMPPTFRDKLVFVRCHSACLVHGLLASRWANRLSGYAVLVVNTGYLPGEVVFSFRANGGEDLIGLLRRQLGPEETLGGTIGYGHRSATGGRFPLDRLPEFLEKMGFADKLAPRNT